MGAVTYKGSLGISPVVVSNNPAYDFWCTLCSCAANLRVYEALCRERPVRERTVDRARVLLADDNHAVLERVSSLIATTFDVVGTAHDGQEMVAKVLALNPDLVVVDISMPILTGIEAMRQLREAGSKTRFVVLTVHEEPEFIDACLEAGALGYVTKSRMRTDLTAAISSALEGNAFVSPVLSRT